MVGIDRIELLLEHTRPMNGWSELDQSNDVPSPVEQPFFRDLGYVL